MSDNNAKICTISTQALQRMPYYLQHLKMLKSQGLEVIAAPAIAENLSLNEVQVRKDFAAISTTKGKPKAGFVIKELIDNMEDFLGYHNVNDAVLIGAGSLGKALLSYEGFDNYGMHIVTAFDIDSKLVGSEICGKTILPVDKLSEMCKRMNIHIGIIAVPEDHAQAVCDQLIDGGILGIWNFAPIYLSTSKDIIVQNENMAVSLALLSKRLEESISKSHTSAIQKD